MRKWFWRIYSVSLVNRLCYQIKSFNFLSPGDSSKIKELQIMSAKILIEDSDEVSGVSTGDTGDKRNDRKSYWIE